MKKYLIMLALAFGVVMTSQAQQLDGRENTSFGNKFGNAAGKVASSTEKTGRRIGHGLGLTRNKEDLYRIKKAYYMPIYDVNLYKGKDAKAFKDECVRRFRQRFPNVNILSVAIPQTEWVIEEVTKDKKVVGYTAHLLCYIVAKDGNEGYLNAKFMYKQYKDVGGKFAPLSDVWPSWERTDALTRNVYGILLQR